MAIIKRLGVFPNTGKENVLNALPDFLDMCRNHGLNPLLPIDLAKDYGCDAFDVEQPATLISLDVAVSLGGDGTLLQMARHLLTYDIPLFGINFGTLGFLAEIDVQTMHKAITRLAQGNYSIEKRSLLKAQVIHEDSGVTVATAHALNEFVIRSRTNNLIHLAISINNSFIENVVNCDNKNSLIDIIKEIIDNPHVLNYRLDEYKLKDFVNLDFENIEIDDLKKIAILLLDKNTLYVNYSDIDFANSLNERDIKFTKSFYEENQ